MPSPSSWADADELMECMGERCLIVKSRLDRDVDQRHAGLAHQFFSVLNAMLHQPLVGGGAERGFEGAGKVADGESAFAGNLRNPDPATHVLMEKFRRSPLLPWRKTSLRTPACFLEHTVPLEKMCSEDKAELIESQQGQSVVAPQEWKDALGDLGHNQIVFEHCQPKVIYPAKTEILGDVIESLARNRIVNVVEGTTGPAPWLRIEINDIGAKWVNGGGGKELVCCPQLIARG